ncbi:hypothetical protein Leryth_024704 [Lithospermum erythrorhizon]|nr:hypothetical protein Leryth_024704 [Lithospermum erythrorhizon]
MASIRRSQSPYHNGATPFSIQSPSHKHLLTTSPSLITKLIAHFHYFTKPPRKFISWKKAFYRCLLFFFLGFLLGIAHFNYFNDLSKPDESAFDRVSFENDVRPSTRDRVTKELSSNRPKESGSYSARGSSGNIAHEADVGPLSRDRETKELISNRLGESGSVGSYSVREADVGSLATDRETKELSSDRLRQSGSVGIYSAGESIGDGERRGDGNDDVSGFTMLERLASVESVKLEVDRVRYDRVENVNESFDDMRKHLIVVTPTYNRGLQSYYLNRLGQVLRLVKPPLLWIVVEMSAASLETAELLRKTGVMYRHLVCGKNLTDVKDRGVHQRNRALEHIELHRLDGIVYFADDDNIYTLELFQSLRKIRRFGTWPVAMLVQSKNKAVLEGPVCNGSQVVGWHTNEKSKRLRRFHVDMSGFAFNSTILWDPKRWRRPTSNLVRQLDSVKEGFQETTFIEQLVEDETQMEGIPHGCSKIMNWHLHLESRELDYPKGWVLQKNLDLVLPTKR